MEAKPSKIKSVMKWWSKCISMVIAKTASRNVAFKAAKIAESAFAGQSETLTRQLATVDALTNEEALDDLEHNADLYIFITQIANKLMTLGADDNHTLNRVQETRIIFSRLVLTKSWRDVEVVVI